MPTSRFRPVAARPRMAACVLGWLTALLLAGCGSPDLAPSERKLVVSTRKVVFDRTFIGYPTVQEVRVTNAARVADRFVVEAPDSPFVVQPVGEVKIAGSGQATVKVMFDPSFVGEFEGELRLRLGEEQVVVSLAGSAERPLSCVSTPCAPARFDPRSGQCVVEPLADGAACTSPDLCLEGTTCQGGICKGTPKTCRPPDSCSIAICNPDVGCEAIHYDPCEPPENPCRVARCDGELGCVEEDAEDYTPCGAMSCKEQNVCIRGKCERFTKVEDGHPCTHACGAGGACEKGVCKRPEGEVLASSWEDEGSAAMEFAVDDAGYLYRLECEHPEACFLASHTPNGFSRFRIPLVGNSRGFFLNVDSAVVWNWERINVYATKGEHRWSRLLTDLLEGIEGEILEVVGMGNDELVVRAWWEGAEGLIGISAADGAVLWQRPFPGALGLGLASDGQGRALVVDPSGPTPMLRALVKEGEESWAIEVPQGTEILAVLPSRLFLAAGGKLDVRSTATGTPAWEREFPPKDVVVSEDHAFVIEEGPNGPRLVVLEVVEGEQSGAAYDLDKVEAFSTLALRGADRAVLLGLQTQPAPTWWLEEFDAEGERAAACSIPDPSVGPASWVFLPPAGGDEARLVVQTEEGKVRTFIAPRLGTPPLGWTAEKGSFLRGGRPR